MTVLATAGHVDHGKSALVEALTGVHPDHLPVERERGMTVDLGFGAAHLPSGREVGIVDVPGHLRYLRNMIAGAGAVTGVLFVVSAVEGWRAQSEEHLGILEALGVEAMVVALTMADRVDARQLDETERDVRRRVARSSVDLVGVVATAAPTGVGLERLGLALDDLVDRLAAPTDRGAPRLWIDRAFSLAGIGTVVTGTLAHGALAHGDEVVLEPSGRPSRVRGLHTHGRTVTELGPGNRIAVRLHRVSPSSIRRGDALVRPGEWHMTHRVDASLRLLGTRDADVGRRGAYAVHIGTAEITARLRVLGAEQLGPGDAGHVRLHLARALPLVPGDRFVLRDLGRGTTVGGGAVLDVDPRRAAATAHPSDSVAEVVAQRGAVELAELARLTGRRIEPDVGRWVIDPDRRRELVDEVRRRLEHRGEEGLALGELEEPVRSVALTLEAVEVRHGRLHLGGPRPTAGEALARRLAADPFRPPRPGPEDRGALLELVANGEVVSCAGTWFARSAVESAASAVAELLADHPEGITVGMVRDRLGTSRRHLIPLLNHLDATGRTRRRGSLRVAGPRLPAAGPSGPG